MSDEFLLPLPNEPFAPSWEAIKRIERVGRLIAGQSGKGNGLIFDGDGVIVEQDSLFQPTLRDPRLIGSLRQLEQQGVSVGLATSRGEHFVEFLRARGLHLEGPLILQEGQVLYHKGGKTYFTTEAYREFLDAFWRLTGRTDIWRKHWADVWASGDGAICYGNDQWQGDCRRSFWFYENDGVKHGEELKEKLSAIARPISQSYDLALGSDYVISLGRMSLRRYVDRGTLGIISVTSAVGGVSSDKSRAAREIVGPAIYIADGFKDGKLEKLNALRGGINIGVAGNLDLASDARSFLTASDATLASPQELVNALLHAVRLLQVGR